MIGGLRMMRTSNNTRIREKSEQEQKKGVLYMLLNTFLLWMNDKKFHLKDQVQKGQEDRSPAALEDQPVNKQNIFMDKSSA